jgi:threonyl-tRNA synthetase
MIVPAGQSAASAIAAAGLPTTGPKAIVVVRDPSGQLRDLDWTPSADTDVEPVAIDSPDGLKVLRHSTAHVMAQAVQDLYPEAKLGIGPPIENGFYYDFGVPKPFHPEDLERIEKRMQEIVKAGQAFKRRRFSSPDEARVELADEPFKLELIDVKGSDDPEIMEVGGGELTIYDNIDGKGGRAWGDLCRGPHLPSTRLIPAFKIMRSAAAYWRGSEKNPQLQRIYGTAWPTRDALKGYLQMLEEAAKRDHRKLGTELDLFSFPDVIGSGWPSSIPRAASSGANLSPTRGSGTRRRGTRSSTRRTSARASCSPSRGTCSGTPTGCTRPWRWRARTTTSSR